VFAIRYSPSKRSGGEIFVRYEDYTNRLVWGGSNPKYAARFASVSQLLQAVRDSARNHEFTAAYAAGGDSRVEIVKIAVRPPKPVVEEYDVEVVA
jgi:hypothetical protein